ncbi:hypothetical protein [Flagellimonas pacifica]|uniref:Uncharacterized protein n=1 Tax=Flagellimonas pacifica TaxID=1247520 RepID=A0A285MBI6_9FLAO|nr:hypothetical protein [Allomuricauda parva]SNY94520.1 hypothetical protein SAMN06265377_0180 [Allomuricauda parva]
MALKDNIQALFLIFLMLVFSCSTDNDETTRNTLANMLNGRETVPGNVIACAASNEDSDVVSVFLYPRNGVVNISFYETESTTVDESDFSNYIKGDSGLLDVFNGYLLKFEISPAQEKWVIVTFEEQGKVHLSNPIRLKQNTKPTEYLPQNVDIDDNGTMPIFSWQDGTFNDSAIYFQVVSDENDNLLSGTYTLDRLFQYYKLENVVLNITREMPPSLKLNNPYKFSLLAVSGDNWVNLFSEVEFSLK